MAYGLSNIERQTTMEEISYTYVIETFYSKLQIKIIASFYLTYFTIFDTIKHNHRRNPKFLYKCDAIFTTIGPNDRIIRNLPTIPHVRLEGTSTQRSFS